MPSAVFRVGPGREHEVRVRFHWFGLESYQVDGRLAARRWSARLRGRRELSVGPHRVVLDVSTHPDDYHCRVFVDGRLAIAELFPDVRARVVRWQRVAGAWWLPLVFAGLILLLLGLYAVTSPPPSP